MNTLPRVSDHECFKSLSKIGFIKEKQNGSHVILRLEKSFFQVDVSAHDELDRGALRVIKQVNLALKEILDLSRILGASTQYTRHSLDYPIIIELHDKQEAKIMLMGYRDIP
ncbi:MAG: type II toxin-antitoxin system HicA family toxin [Promethearchaeota archaeon]